MNMSEYSDCDPGSYPLPKSQMGYTNKFHPYNSYDDTGYTSVQMMAPLNYHGQQNMYPNPSIYSHRQQQQPRHDIANVHPLGYGSSRRPQQISQQPQPSQALYSHSLQGYQRTDHTSYASAASQYIPQQSIGVKSHMTTVPSSQQTHQQDTKAADLLALKMTLSEEKKQKESDQEAYAARFLQAVQERVQGIQQHEQQQQNGLYAPYDTNGFYDPSLEMYEFEAQHQSNQQFQLSSDLLQRIDQIQNKMVIYEIQIGLEQLIAEPNEYDTWAVAIKDRLMTKEGMDENLEVGSWMIIEMAMNSKDSQCLLARLSAYLIEAIQDFNNYFTSNLEYFVTERSSISVETLQNLLIFTAEIYERALLSNRNRNVHFAVMVFDLMRTLKEKSITDSTVKSLVDVLKLCGYHLQLDSYSDAVNDIVYYLETLTKSGRKPKTLTDTGCGYITSLMINFKEWGKDKPNDVANARYHIEPNVNSMDLTDEEIGFLEKHGAMEPAYVHNGYGTEFDDEILDDYEKFLRDNEYTAISAAEKILEKLSIDEDDCPPEDLFNDGSKKLTSFKKS